MNKFAMVLGAAAVVTLAGCKDPNYAARRGGNNEVKTVSTTSEPEATKPVVIVANPAPVEKHCMCAPGTKHEAPCTCGAPDCKCVVVAKPVAPVAPAAEPEYTIYVVQQGDYLAKISKKYNLTVASIKRLNGLKSDTVRVGQKLKLPGKVEVGAQTAPAAAPVAKSVKPAAKPVAAYTGATKEYVVKNGDTLGAIAYGNGITIRQLRQLNGLKSDALKVGQKLKVPAEKVAKPAAPVKEAKEAVAPAPAPTVTKPEQAKPVQATPAPAPEKPVETPAVAPVADEPAADAVDAAPAPAAAQQNTYKVVEGDDITSVSIKWGVSAAEIRELNNLPEDAQLKPGQEIKLPPDAQL